ncbi:hypothetical protein GCM10009738_72990 [Kitasatospora viridis]|uniref:Uncharacterized protein n=2 Tax=Kitasatospora viridis TaxID=281105 RepID=A0A561TWT8_9ACTN|nr:hypothetical protein FHX73_12678 [Kitasatospora viridis]
MLYFGVVVALTLGPALWVRPAPDPPFVLFVAFVGGLLPMLAATTCSARGPLRVHEADPNLLTARTGTGERTVDLGQIARISSFEFLSRGTYDSPALIVKDRRGVRLGVTTLEGYRLVRDAVERQAAMPVVPAPRISRTARRILDEALPAWWEFLRGWAYSLYGTAVGVACLIVALEVART